MPDKTNSDDSFSFGFWLGLFAGLVIGGLIVWRGTSDVLNNQWRDAAKEAHVGHYNTETGEFELGCE